MIKLRINSQNKKELTAFIKELEQKCMIKYLSDPYESSNNPKYKNSKEIRIYADIEMK
ncbi:YvzF family protein [Bacillus sp. 03113]|uniref:YvzF family protein n=1 Tax=Bacillus sp. 03113 TaxID=2578211 RepID=UPI00215CB299|nr:YvzF family protein [Bacillus sp. 03113]